MSIIYTLSNQYIMPNSIYGANLGKKIVLTKIKAFILMK